MGCCVANRGDDRNIPDASSVVFTPSMGKSSTDGRPGLPSLAVAAHSVVPRRTIMGEGIGAASFIHEKYGRVQDLYDLDSKKLGQGAYGEVRRGIHKELRGDSGSKLARAIKTVPKDNIGKERIQREIGILKLLDHPGIIKLYETFEDQRSIYLVMELCTGGDLFERILKLGHFTEANAASVMQQITRAIFYMHEANVVHRDMKPENFLLLNAGPIDNNVLKIIDFGLSCIAKPGQMMTTKVGTPYYVAPQVLRGSYDRACDLWSAGVIMYVLLSGYPPFSGKCDAEVFAKVRLGKVKFDKKDWEFISGDAQDMIMKLLHMNPKERLTAEQALHHDWVVNAMPSYSRLSLRPGFVESLRQFRSQGKLKKAALQVIAGLVSERDIQVLRDIFIQMDCNGDGLLTLGELQAGLLKAGLKEIPEDLEDIMRGIDADGSGVIDYTEFLAASLERKSYCEDDVLRAAFHTFDLNGDGRITRDELHQVLAVDGLPEAKVLERAEAIIKEHDVDGDGTINLEEFRAMMRNNATEDRRSSSKR
eukprot:TRINITY_DN10275_c0_g1_i1.p1 TRINITY_DN10275_c0_g1~~TRINITY_DN10275_c0_g1_i1.p1  ORF type:complete len:535 (+),score=103.95 TRINITY_DN10275_c0_g1_i1:67-1671(+)